MKEIGLALLLAGILLISASECDPSYSEGGFVNREVSADDRLLQR